jgi:NAD(P)-dependent dehydrogenase (short-subunit alcohol dehydrogenase family)
MPNPSKKIALVTGANKGIGLEVARQIGRSGATVLLGARNKLAGEKAAAVLAGEGLAAHFIAIDVADHDSVSAAAATITNEFSRLDILVNNAGINAPDDGRPSTASLDAVERVFRTNFLGAVAVTQAMLTYLRMRPYEQSITAHIV